MNLLLAPVLLPLASAFLILPMSEKGRRLKGALTLAASAVSLAAALMIFALALFSRQPEFCARWLSYGLDFALKADALSSVTLLFVSLFTFLTALYSLGLEKKGGGLVRPPQADDGGKWFYCGLLGAQAFAAGAALSDNLLALLFFWEGLPVFLCALIARSKAGRAPERTAMKAFLVNAASGLCLLAGAAVTTYIAGSMSMSEISAGRLTMNGWAAFGYALMLAAAVSKCGALPFHAWTTDAASESGAPFMAYAPAALDKLLGIYLLARISIGLFALNEAAQFLLISLGAATVLLAAGTALVQTDYKRLLSYLAAGQAGYMMLGIGTLEPAGAAGGLLHMLNASIFLSCLFMTAGAVESRTGAVELSKLGGLFKAMPVTALCFILAAAAAAGLAPLNGFFSREMICGAVLSAGGAPFFLAAELGSALTLASLLKLGHSVFFGRRPESLQGAAEAPLSALLPMLTLAGLCLLFGFGARIPLDFFIVPSLRDLNLAHEALGGFRLNPFFWTSLIVALAAVVNHMFGCAAAKGEAHKSSDHIRRAPVLREMYELAAAGLFDPYEQFMKRLPGIAGVLRKADRFFDSLTYGLPSSAAGTAAGIFQRFHTGSYPLYLALTIAGSVVYIIFTAAYGGIR